MKTSRPMSLENLEDRCVPTSSISLQAGVLNIVADPGRAHNAMISSPASGGIQVQLDNQQFSTTDSVTQINYNGGGRANNFTNLTNIAGTLQFGDGNNIVLSKAAGEIITAGNGRNFIQDQAGGSTITVGNGRDSVYGGPGDTISVGSGRISFMTSWAPTTSPSPGTPAATTSSPTLNPPSRAARPTTAPPASSTPIARSAAARWSWTTGSSTSRPITMAISTC
jgi:hypothetical protein